MSNGFNVRNITIEQSLDASINYNDSIVNINSNYLSSAGVFTFTGTAISQQTIISRGCVWSISANPTINDNKVEDNGIGSGTFTVNFYYYGIDLVYARAYCQTSAGYFYGSDLTAYPVICLAEGTHISLYNGDRKNIENITYDDELLVWDFDNGKFTFAKPLWIKHVQISTEFNVIEFSNDTDLKTIGDHRIYNKLLGKFSHVFTDDEMPIGSETYSLNKEHVHITNKYKVFDKINFYNIITNVHMNLFADNILTSNRYSNLYEIKNMKYIKPTNNEFLSIELFKEIPEKYINGMRLLENKKIPIQDTITYINRLEILKLII